MYLWKFLALVFWRFCVFWGMTNTKITKLKYWLPVCFLVCYSVLKLHQWYINHKEVRHLLKYHLRCWHDIQHSNFESSLSYLKLKIFLTWQGKISHKFVLWRLYHRKDIVPVLKYHLQYWRELSSNLTFYYERFVSIQNLRFSTA